MRFTIVLLPFVAMVAAQQQSINLSSLYVQASAAAGTNSVYQSMIKSEFSALQTLTPYLTNPTYSSIFYSVLSQYEAELSSLSHATAATATGAHPVNTASISSAFSSASASISSAVKSAVSSASASAAQASSTSRAGVDRIAIPAIGAFGAGILGLAAML